MNDEYLKPEDYQEPVCPFCTSQYDDKPTDAIPTCRVLKKLDEYFESDDFLSAERHLKYWLEESQYVRDKKGEFLIRNEMIGFYRKLGKKDEALKCVNDMIEFMPKMDFSGSTGEATAFINMATAYKAFGMSDMALPYFEKAKATYEKTLDNSDNKLAGLYNNMGLALADLKRYDEAYNMYQNALKVLSNVENGELESAITYLNMASLKEAQSGLYESEKTIEEYLDKAIVLLDTQSLERNGYYAFVCEKCKPTFSYHGYFAYAGELQARIDNIKKRSQK